MIRCPSCGTLNQDSLKVCSNCGATLPQTTVRCPQCGTPNPVGNLLCDNCNARLVHAEGIIPSGFPADEDSTTESTQVKGISLPSRPSASDSDVDDTDDAELPDWLRDLTQESNAFFGTELDGATASDDEYTSDDDMAPTDDSPDDWLSDLLSTGDAMDEVDVTEEEPLTFDADALPEWFTAESSEPPSEKPLPEETAQPSEGALPDWLQSPPEAAAEAESDARTLPSWLLGSAETSDDDFTAAVEEEPEGSLAWLDALDDQETDSAAGGATDADPDEETGIFPESELPEWLSEAQALGTADATDIADAAPDGERQVPLPEAELSADLPDWLSDLEGDQGFGGAEAPQGAAAPDDVELPEWLQVPIEEPPPEEGALPTVAREDVPPPAPLEDVGPAATEEDKAQVTKPAASLPGDEGASLASQPEAPLPADIPEWLAALAEPASGPEAMDKQQAQPEAPRPAEEGPDLASQPAPEESTEDLAWLEGIQPASEAAAPPSVIAGDDADTGETPEAGILQAAEPQETPEWLQALDFAASPEPQPAPKDLEDDMPAPAELPGWLQDLRPEGVAPDEGTPAVLGLPGDLVSAEIPEWLLALRPTAADTRDQPPRRAALPTPAEPEGPLQGIPGVLQPRAFVDAPADVKPVTDAPVSEAVISQAQLWQTLLEQPRSAQRVVTTLQPRGTATTGVVRLLVAALFVLGTVLLLQLWPTAAELVATPAASMAPGAEALIAAIDGVEPGDDVIVAIEYGAAYAEEMSYVASPIIRHLVERQADITLVSTLPEGKVLGPALLANAGRDITDVTYIPGDAPAVIAYLARPGVESATRILLLASQPERFRWWVEQTAIAAGLAPDRPAVSAGVSASAGRFVAPYLQSSQVQGWLVGVPDALAYGELRGTASETGLAQKHGVLMLAHWLAGGLIIVGLVVALVGGRKRGAVVP